jgi:serine/threonine protein phosphatase PrpC
MEFMIQACTDVGTTKKTNQDSFSVKILNTAAGKMVFAIMCDGMGGLEKGEVASATVVTAFNKWVESELLSVTQEQLTNNYIRSVWTNLIVDYNEKIKIYGKKCGVNLGTTATVMLITSECYYIANVGDTRAYELTSSENNVLTKDQTVVARELEQGLITEEQAHTDSRRSVLLQCIGASEKVYPDFFFGETKADAVYMLCTDGFRHEITPQEIYQYLNPEVMTNEDIMQQNINYLIALDKQRQERDNISVVTVRT